MDRRHFLDEEIRRAVDAAVIAEVASGGIRLVAHDPAEQRLADMVTQLMVSEAQRRLDGEAA